MEPLMLLSWLDGPFFTIKNGLIVSLALNILCLVLIVAIFVYRQMTMPSDDDLKDVVEDSIERKGGRLRKAVKGVVLRDEEVSAYITKLGHNEDAVTQEEVEQMVKEKLDKALAERKMVENADQRGKTQASGNASQDGASVLYATAVNEERHAFYEVTIMPKNGTVFLLDPDPKEKNRATFTVYDKAFKKVIEEQGYLKGGCIIENPEMNNTSSVKVLERGKAILKEGEWVIEVKAKVKFV